MNDTDIVLLNRWRGAGDAEAFSGLVARHADMVYAVCRRITGSPTEAEDVAQECFLRLARCKDSIRSSVAGWLHGLAVWRSLDWLRAEGRRRRLEHTYSESARSVEIAWNDLQPHIDEAIADLPVRTRDLIVRHFLEGETHAQIADSLGLSRSSVTRSINRGIERVRKTLRRKGVPVEMPALVALIGKHGAEAAPATLKVSLGKLALSGIVPAQPFNLGSLLGIGVGGTRLVTREVLLLALGVIIVLGVTTIVKRAPATGLSSSASAVGVATTPSSVAANGTNPATTPSTPSAAKPEQPIVFAAAAPDKTAKESTQKTSSVSGRIRDLFGANPIAGVHVQVSAKKDAYDFSPKLYFAESNANGDYILTGLDIIGPAEIAASATGYGDQCKEITLREGDALRNVDIEIYKGFEYVGQVLSRLGVPVAGAVVVPQRMRIPLVVTDKDGFFRFRSNYGDVSVAVEIIAKGCGAALFTDVVFKSGEVTSFRLPSPASMRGRLSWSDGSPAVGCIVHTKPITDEEIEIKKKGLPTQEFALDFTATAGADGHYEINNLAPNLRYSVWFSQADGHALAGYTGAVGPLPSGGAYEFDHVLTKPATVSGTIAVSNSDIVLKSAYVRALREGPDSVSYLDLHANDGKYVLNIAEPGTYLISADYGYPQHLHETDSEMKMYERRLEVKEGDIVNLDLEAPPPYVFAVRAVGVDGKIVPATQFGLTWPCPDGNALGTWTTVAADSQGRFVWYCKSGRELWITASADGYIQASTEHVTTKAGVVAPEQTLVLHRAGSLKANLIDSDDVKHGVHLQVTYPDGVVADMPTTNHGGGSYGVVNAVRAGRMTVIAIEEKTDTPHRSQPVECTVAPGEVYDLGDMVVE